MIPAGPTKSQSACTLIVKFSPAIFGIRLDGRLDFRERKFEAHISVDMAVRHVMHHLADRPPTFAVGCIELLRRQILNRGANGGRCFLDVSDEFLPLLGRRHAFIMNFPMGNVDQPQFSSCE